MTDRFTTILKQGRCPVCGSTTLTVKKGKLICNDCGEVFGEGEAK